MIMTINETPIFCRFNYVYDSRERQNLKNKS